MSTNEDELVGEYMRRLLLAKKRGLIDGGTIFHAKIYHDDWCAQFSSRACNCDPDIAIETSDGVVMVDRNGTLSMSQPH
jgi:hypothetical protein